MDPRRSLLHRTQQSVVDMSTGRLGPSKILASKCCRFHISSSLTCFNTRSSSLQLAPKNNTRIWLSPKQKLQHLECTLVSFFCSTWSALVHRRQYPTWGVPHHGSHERAAAEQPRVEALIRRRVSAVVPRWVAVGCVVESQDRGKTQLTTEMPARPYQSQKVGLMSFG